MAVAIPSGALFVTVIRLSPDGTVLSKQALSLSLEITQVALDPFGGVVVAATTCDFCAPGALSVMKYNSLTGRPMWPVPARIRWTNSGGGFSLGLSPSGDVYVSGGVDDGAVTFCYDGRTGSVRWGPKPIPAGSFGQRFVVDPHG
ncbi:MAG TPA: hypothetical protein VF376_09240, partial [Thermoanaerobaculia bacterium]